MRVVALLFVALTLLSTGCEEEDPLDFRPGCEVTLDAVAPPSADAAGGVQATISGLWIASEAGVRDTVVRVGGLDALVLDVVRETCDTCAACSGEAVRCRECEAVCRGNTQWTDAEGQVYDTETCTEQIVFEVPASTIVGDVEISVTTRHGEASGLWFTYTD